MNLPNTVGGRERLRLFCALTLPADVRDALAAWQRYSLRCHARLIERADLHLTLAYLGHRPEAELRTIAESLGEAARSLDGPIVLSPLRYRETRSVAMLVLTDEHGRAERLALDVHERLERLGVYEREARRWLPHVTVLRFQSPPGLRPPVPAVSPFSPSEAAVYHSLLVPGGAKYEVLESVPLGG